MFSKKRMLTALTALCLGTLVLAGCGGNSVEEKKEKGALGGTINIATAGDTNMVEFFKRDVNALFTERISKDVKLNVVGTGPGDAGSVAIYNKLKAQKDANKEKYDIDVAIVHQSIMKQLIEADLIEKWLPMATNKSGIISDDSINALGQNVEGYVAPLFHSQVAIAFNSEKINKPFATIDELEGWIKANPNRFGYNGIKNGASGVAFVTGYVYAKTGDYDKMSRGPVDQAVEDKWVPVIKELKALPVVYTNGNNGTLDMLNRGEIDAGPVWVDMFNTWLAEGRMNKNVQLALPAPGFPGQPMYVVIIKKNQNKDAALAYADYLISPEVQGKVVVEKFNWYPGIDAGKVMSVVSDATKEALFKNITPEILNKNGQSFPFDSYFKDLKDAYEKN